MRTRAQMGILRDGGTQSDRDGPKSVKNGAFADGTVIADLEIPRDDDPHIRMDMDIRSDPRAEAAQDEAAPAP